MTSPKIGFMCASLREGSINQKLQTALIKRFKAAGATTSKIDLNKFYFPLYHGDLDTPPEVKKLIHKMKGYDGIVIVTPEYNGSLPPLLKNTIDWTSTVETGHITGPVYGIASCTPGPMSGIMCMRQVQFILTRLGGVVMPAQAGCGNAASAFNSKDELTAQPALKLADKMRDQMMERISRKG